MSFNITDTNITLTNGYSLDFEYPIKEAKLINDIIIIVLAIPINVINNQNVFAITTTGDFLWRISETPPFGTSTDCPYVGIIVNKDDELALINFCSTGVIVNALTGDIIRKYQIW